MQIYLSAWSLKEPIRRGNLNLEDLPRFAIRHGFSGIELVDRQIQTSDSGYLENLGRKYQKHNCGVILDVSSDLTYTDEKTWLDQIAYVGNMLDDAKRLGAGKVRITLGGQSLSFQKIFQRFDLINSDSDKTAKMSILQPAKYLLHKLVVNKSTVQFVKSFRKNGKATVKNEAPKIERAIQALSAILPKAERHQIPLVIENHWGISSRPENIIKIINEFDSAYLGACPDFDNFPKEVDRYEGLKTLSSKALHVHAKSIFFDADGEEKNIDYKRCLQILKDNDYADTITVEYEGAGDAVRGCLQTKDLILKHW